MLIRKEYIWMAKDMEMLIANFDALEGTFLYYLHEEASFNEEAFWEYYNSVVSITSRTLNNAFDRTVAKAINYTYSRIIESFLWHLTENDGYLIENYPEEKIHLYVERLRYMVDGYFEGFVVAEDVFGDELKNPKETKNKLYLVLHGSP
jgi:hypothetical protein